MRSRIAALLWVACWSCSGPPSSEQSQAERGQGPADTIPVAISGVVSPSSDNAASACRLFDVPLQVNTRWYYARRYRDRLAAVVEVRVTALTQSEAELTTEVATREERLHWTTVFDCASHVILRQQIPELAYGFSPFPGFGEGQIIDVPSPGPARVGLPPKKPSQKPRELDLVYSPITRSDGRARLSRTNDRGAILVFEIAPSVGIVSVRASADVSMDLIGEAEATALQETLDSEEEERGTVPHPGAKEPLAIPAGTPGVGFYDYTQFCFNHSSSTYNGHWPELAYRDVSGIVSKYGRIAGDDLTYQHDDRDSEFKMLPDDEAFVQGFLAYGQSEMEVEWESVVWFPKHPQLADNYPAPPAGMTETPLTPNHFTAFRDPSFQSPRIGDSVRVRGAVVVDCGHAPATEIHPPSAVAWRHRFNTGIADYFVRLSSYGWYPHVQHFEGLGATLDNGQPIPPIGTFVADFDIPDAASSNQAPYLGPVVVDYAYSGYDVSDDQYTLSTSGYDPDHPAAHLFGGDYGQPPSTYFDLSVSLIGTTVHITAYPTPAWSTPSDSPQRPALVGIHFMACVPLRDPDGLDVNGCVGGGNLEPAQPFIGQIVPAPMGGTITGWVQDRHLPRNPVTLEVRAYADTCDTTTGHEEVVLGTATTDLNNQFSFLLPTAPRVCTPSSPGNPAANVANGIIIRALSEDIRPDPAAVELFRYKQPSTCLISPDLVTSGPLCPDHTGYGGTGYTECSSSQIVPYCLPRTSGQPTLPGAPAGVTATAGSNLISLSWQATPGAAQYNVYTVSGGLLTRAAQVLRDTRASISEPNGATQTFVVTAVNSIGEGPASAAVTGTSLHCSQNCPSGCCSGEVCNTSGLSNGCVIGGQACGNACPAGTDLCSNGHCICHQTAFSVCNPTVGQADYHRACGTYPDACGNLVNCGNCPTGWSCVTGINGYCACNPLSQAAACAAYACGTYAPDGCGGSVYCGACPPPDPPPPTCKNCVIP